MSRAVFIRVVLFCLALVGVAGLASSARGADLHVGPGQRFARVEEALGAAKAGDTILVHAPAAGAAYEKVALLVRTPRLTIRAVPDAGGGPVRLEGKGFDYSGSGRVPRAIVQFDPAAGGCTLEGFDLSGAHNASHNGAGVRINQADHVTVRNCTIRDNDMGVMSNGDGKGGGGADQRIESCLIERNGATSDPGYSHNLYLGGNGVVVSACEIRASTAGHNLKSRAHYTRVEYCWIHDSANREIDLVDAPRDTDTPGSDAVLIGNIIAKARAMSGNRTVINFGQDGGHGHTGTIYLVNNTIITPYASPVVQLSAPGARARLVNNLVSDGGAGAHHQVLVAPASKESKDYAAGGSNAFSRSFDDPLGLGSRVELGGTPFRDAGAGDFRLENSSLVARGQPIGPLKLPGVPGSEADQPGRPLRRYLHPLRSEPRSDEAAPRVGAEP